MTDKEKEYLLQTLVLLNLLVEAIDHLTEAKAVFHRSKQLSGQLLKELISQNQNALYDSGGAEEAFIQYQKDYEKVIKAVAELGPEKIHLVADVLVAAKNNGIRYEHEPEIEIK